MRPVDPQTEHVPSFLERVVALGRLIPPTHVPLTQDVTHALAGLAAVAEHGEKALDAADHGLADVIRLFDPEYQPPENIQAGTPGATVTAAGSAVQAPPADNRDQELALLRQELASANARISQLTSTASVDPVHDEPDQAAPASSSSSAAPASDSTVSSETPPSEPASVPPSEPAPGA